MKVQAHKKYPAGYTSLLLVFTTSIFMLAIMIFAYRRAADAQATLADIQVQTDYREKEEAMLRAIVALTPNRAIKAMQDGSDSSDERRTDLSFQSIFEDAITRANARTSVSAELLQEMEAEEAIVGNSGDSALNDAAAIFTAATDDSGRVTSGLNRDLGEGFPPALDFAGSLVDSDTYPIITDLKQYGSYASGAVALSTDDYQDYNLIPYPDIDFGYAEPGELFVAKRNWWAFRMNLASHDRSLTGLANLDRTFVLSIYEIPSQLPISGSAFMSLGGAEWDNATISGNVFAGRAEVGSSTALASLASRRGMTISEGATIGGQTFDDSPFAPGVRETYRLTNGDFFPVSLSSESGRAAFIPISRGADYFDRFSHANETEVISPTTWNQYSVGALECAMTLDISECVSTSDRTPTELTFSYLLGGERQKLVMDLVSGAPSISSLLPYYQFSANENQTVTFDEPVDVIYGRSGILGDRFYGIRGVSGAITFDNATFKGDPAPLLSKAGYWKPLDPFEIKTLASGKICVAVYPQRFKDFMERLGADGLDVNHSLAINVNYRDSIQLTKPNIPSADNDYGVILEECENITDFTKGFSIVTNLRLHFGDDFNTVPTAAPANYPPDGYTPPSAEFYPPTSIFAPEKRYGAGITPLAVDFDGSLGSVADDDIEVAINPLETKTVTGQSMSTASNLRINLSTIGHPAELPPITMKNWLIVLEEKR